MRSIRLDDYPFCKPDYPDRQWVVDRFIEMCEVFNRYDVEYFIGVIPTSLDNNDMDILDNSLLSGNGKAVMHGFTHGFDRWESVILNLKTGGEFSGRTYGELLNEYEEALSVMRILDSFDDRHFIAPFNCYTQELVEVLETTFFKYLHTANKEYSSYGYADFTYGKVQPVIAEYEQTYAHIDTVLKHLDCPSQIALHWIFDAQQNPHWLDRYDELCRKISA